jgi:hypothetical protein
MVRDAPNVALLMPGRWAVSNGIMTEEKTFRLQLPWGSKAFLLGMLIVFLAVTVFMFVLPFVATGPETPPAFIGVFWLLIVGWNLFWFLRFPYQIVLGSDGTIEFKAIIRKVRMNASEIKAESEKHKVSHLD